jgi:hypothetical protein
MVLLHTQKAISRLTFLWFFIPNFLSPGIILFFLLGLKVTLHLKPPPPQGLGVSSKRIDGLLQDEHFMIFPERTSYLWQSQI